MTRRTSVFAVSVQGAQYDNVALSGNIGNKLQMVDSQSLPEYQLKRDVLIGVIVTLLSKWKVNLGNFPAASETGTPCIDIKTL